MNEEVGRESLWVTKWIQFTVFVNRRLNSLTVIQLNIKHDKRCVVGVFQHIKFP